MSTNPATMLEHAERWTTALRERGLATEEALSRLDQVLIQSRGERLDAPDDPLLVLMLCGPTTVGKSSLINALAGAEISRQGIGATTSAAVLYVHEKDDPARLFEYSETLGRLGRDATTLVRHSRDELLHKVLVDTPDIDSVVLSHRETTASLVHQSDLVLFVTSPERYKIMDSARWIKEQREQRAIGFVLNKWDRMSLGLDYDRRELVDKDLRKILADQGFASPLVFKVSALDSGDVSSDNELGRLRLWIEQGLSRSAASAIQDRRRRAAWGRVGAVVAPAVPTPLSGHPLVASAGERLAADRTRAKKFVEAEASAITVEGLDRSVRPATLGLLGSWVRFWDRIGGIAGSIVSLFTFRKIGAFMRSAIGSASDPDAASDGFGQPAAALLAQAAAQLALEADRGKLPLGPVAAVWTAEAQQLQQRLGSAVAEGEAEVIAECSRLTPRRAVGIAALYAVEAALVAVLLMTLWRLGTGFAYGQYVAGDLIANAAALMIGLLLAGQILGNLFFPPLQKRLRQVVSRRAGRLIEEAWQRVQSAFSEQLQAADRLSEEGQELMTSIDGMVRTLAPAGPADSDVGRLFGEAAEAPAVTEAPKASPPKRKVVLD